MNLKNLFFLTIISWSLGIMACEDEPTEVESLDYPFTLENVVPAPDIEQSIDDIEAYLEDPRPDELESMNIKDVVWSVEATLNRKYTNAAHNFEQLHTQTDTITIAHSANMMSAYEVRDFYDEALAKFSEHFYSLPDDNRLPVLVDVAEYADDPNSLILTTQVGTGTLGAFILGFQNDWWWGLNNGPCDDGQINYGEGDAAEELETELNNRALVINDLGIIPCATNTNPPVCYSSYYPVDVEIVLDGVFPGTPNPDDVTFNDNHRDYLLYYNHPAFIDTNWEENKCIPIDDMDYYFDGAVQKIDLNRPTGKDFITVDMEGDALIGGFPNYVARHYMPTLSFGKMLLREEEGGSEDPPIQGLPY